jgi:hypothetical protein
MVGRGERKKPVVGAEERVCASGQGRNAEGFFAPLRSRLKVLCGNNQMV